MLQQIHNHAPSPATTSSMLAEFKLANAYELDELSCWTGMSTKSLQDRMEKFNRAGGYHHGHRDEANDTAKKKRCRKVRNGQIYVTSDFANTLLEPRPGVLRVLEKPAGSMTIKALHLEAGISRRQIGRLIDKGSISASYYKGIYYLDAEAAQFYIERRRLLSAPIGWVLLADLPSQAGRSRQTVYAYAKRHEWEIRNFFHPTRYQMSAYVREEDARTYLTMTTAKQRKQIQAAREAQEHLLVILTPDAVHHQDIPTQDEPPAEEGNLTRIYPRRTIPMHLQVTCHNHHAFRTRHLRGQRLSARMSNLRC